MTDFTKVNLREVKDSASGGGLGEINEARFAKGDLAMTKLGISYQKLFAGKRSRAGHKHSEQEELFIILSGSGHMKLDDDVIDVGPLDAVRVGQGVVRGLEAGSDPLEFVVVGAPLLQERDFEFVQDFWALAPSKQD